MKQELEAILYERYPEIFAERNQPPEISGMHWGITCGDAWFPLVDALCAEIDWQINELGMPPVVARQVKEKLGTLRFRFRGGNDATRALAGFALRLSAHICDTCGQLQERDLTEPGAVCSNVNCCCAMAQVTTNPQKSIT